MVARFGAPLVAFAVAAATVTKSPLLPEFLSQLRDPNLLGPRFYELVLRTFGYADVLALCAVLSAASVLLVAWRTRMRGASDWHATLAAAIFALCLTPWLGVSLQPIGWVCAAATCLLLDRDGDLSLLSLLFVLLLWSLMQGGATLGALLAILACIGRALDERVFSRAVRGRAVVALAAVLVGSIQLHALPWNGYGAHALYLDSLLPGAQHEALWTRTLTPPQLGFCAIVLIAAWYGLRRRGRSSDAITFFALLVLALLDARNLPYFAIAGAPVAVDSLASYYLTVRSVPNAGALGYGRAFVAAALLFVASIALTEPKVVDWPTALEQPGALLTRLAARHGYHLLLCERPRWCDGVQLAFPNIRAVADDRAGLARRSQLQLQRDVAGVRAGWRRRMQRAGVDAVIASRRSTLTALLEQSGWKTHASDRWRVLLERT